MGQFALRQAYETDPRLVACRLRGPGARTSAKNGHTIRLFRDSLLIPWFVLRQARRHSGLCDHPVSFRVLKVRAHRRARLLWIAFRDGAENTQVIPKALFARVWHRSEQRRVGKECRSRW